VKVGNGEVTENSVMEVPAFTSVIYNSHNVIIGFIPDSTSV